MRKLRAITTVEIIVVIGIMAIVATATYINFVSYYYTSVVDAELRTVASNIQRARQKAIGNTTGSDYSIKFLSGSYVMFAGTTYTAGAAGNIVYGLDNIVVVSTTFPSDIVTFNNFNGRAVTSGQVSISAGSIANTIVINSLGIVEDIN